MAERSQPKKSVARSPALTVPAAPLATESPPAADPPPAEAAASSPDPLAHLDALLAERKLREAIAEAEALLGHDPPVAMKGPLYRLLSKSHYDYGDNVSALRYAVLYREYCPTAELPALDKKICAAARRPRPRSGAQTATRVADTHELQRSQDEPPPISWTPQKARECARRCPCHDASEERLQSQRTDCAERAQARLRASGPEPVLGE